MGVIMGENNSEEFMDSLSNIRKDIIDDCMIALGYPVVSIFITQEQINKLIDFSVRKCAGKACPTFLRLANAGSGVLNISEWGAEAIKHVYSGDISGVSTPSNGAGCSECTNCTQCNPGGSVTGSPLSGCDICNKLCQYRMYSYGMVQGDWNNSLYDMLAMNSAKAETEKLILDDVYYDRTSGMLYLDNYSGVITIEYTKSRPTIEDLENDSMWSSWVRDYTLAMVKITEGRIRSKYKITSGVFEIESDELISEGNSDKQELEERLNENIGYYNIM